MCIRDRWPGARWPCAAGGSGPVSYTHLDVYKRQIVLSKARERGTVIPDEVAQLIAKKMRSNVRELEGAINKLTAQAGLLGRPVTLEFAQETLRDLWRAQQQAISIGNIQKAVADYYGPVSYTHLDVYKRQGLMLGVLFFYVMGSQSMIFCAGIAAIGLFFCKPSQAKISSELQIDEE